MRETHSVMISRAVHSTFPGFQRASSGVWSGQPMVLKGQRAELNQVSSTSGSRRQPRSSSQAMQAGSSRSRQMWVRTRSGPGASSGHDRM